MRKTISAGCGGPSVRSQRAVIDDAEDEKLVWACVWRGPAAHCGAQSQAHILAGSSMRLLLASLCALLCSAQAYAASTGTFADFDGDGHRDRVTIDAVEPSIVRVYLSATRSTHVIHSAQPLQAIAAADLNGDHRAELIATTRSSGLRIWTKAHSGFRAYRRKRPDPRNFHRPDRRTINDDDDDAAGTVAAAKPGPPAAAATIRRRGPPDVLHIASRALSCRGCASDLLPPFSPRPPPVL